MSDEEIYHNFSHEDMEQYKSFMSCNALNSDVLPETIFEILTVNFPYYINLIQLITLNSFHGSEDKWHSLFEGMYIYSHFPKDFNDCAYIYIYLLDNLNGNIKEVPQRPGGYFMREYKIVDSNILKCLVFEFPTFYSKLEVSYLHTTCNYKWKDLELKPIVINKLEKLFKLHNEKTKQIANEKYRKSIIEARNMLEWESGLKSKIIKLYGSD